MKAFARLVQALEETNNPNDKLEALASYFDTASDKDKLWTIAILSHRRPKRSVKTNLLRAWAAETAGIESWLFEESYHIVGDLAETIALLISGKNKSDNSGSLSWNMEQIIAMLALDEVEKKSKVLALWSSLDYYSCFVFNKLITGGFRIGVSQKLMTWALSQSTGIRTTILAHWITGNWDPKNSDFKKLILDESGFEDIAKPYPFHLAHPFDKELNELGVLEDWAAEWKWDGIRGQIIIRVGELFIWSRDEELLTCQFPELDEVRQYLPNGTVLDGELLAFQEGRPLDYNALQRRLGHKRIGPKLLKEVPVIFMAYDLLEYQGSDIRSQAFKQRRKYLERLISDVGFPFLRLSPKLNFKSWDELAQLRETSRKYKAEGIMLKHVDGRYQSGRVKGDMWKWKVDPYTIDAVLTFANRGQGEHSNLYTNYTFGLWKAGELVTFAKTFSGLTDEAFREVDHFVRQHTIERFGPVRQVVPELVFELAFEGIVRSSRHKSGIATRFPRIKRWRKDKRARDANKLEDIFQLLDSGTLSDNT